MLKNMEIEDKIEDLFAEVDKGCTCKSDPNTKICRSCRISSELNRICFDIDELHEKYVEEE